MPPRFEHPFQIAHSLPSTHTRLCVEPSHNPGLRYAIAIPKGWGQADGLVGPLPQSQAEILGVFSASADLSGPRVMVTCTPLRWEVDPLAWVRHGLERAGWQTVTEGWLNTPSGRFEIGSVRSAESGTEVRRCTGWVDNGRLLRVDVVTPVAQWDALHDQVWACGPLMKLAKATRLSAVERHTTYQGPAWQLALPDSWSVRGIDMQTGNRHCWIAQPRDAVQGAVALRVDVWSGGAPAAGNRISTLRRNLVAEGTSMARMGSPLVLYDPQEVDGIVSAKRFAATRGEHRGAEVWLCQLDRSPLVADLTMVVHDPDAHAIDRLRGARALDIALHTFVVQPEALRHAG